MLVATFSLGSVWKDSCQSLTKISKQHKKGELNKEPLDGSEERWEDGPGEDRVPQAKDKSGSRDDQSVPRMGRERLVIVIQIQRVTQCRSEVTAGSLPPKLHLTAEVLSWGIHRDCPRGHGKVLGWVKSVPSPINSHIRKSGQISNVLKFSQPSDIWGTIKWSVGIDIAHLDVIYVECK